VVSKQEQNTPKPVFSGPEPGIVRDMKEFFNTLGRFTCCGQTRHDNECRTPLYAPGAQVLFTFLDMGVREDTF